MELERFDRFFYVLVWKPANRSLKQTPLCTLGQNFPFAEVYEAFKNTERNSSKSILTTYKLGKRHALTLLIAGDAQVQAAKTRFLIKVDAVESTPWWRANGQKFNKTGVIMNSRR